MKRATERPSIHPVFLALLALLLTAGAAFGAGTKTKEKPKDEAETTYNAGVEAMKKGDWAAAAGQFEKALGLKEMAGAHNNLAYSLRKQGADNYEKALEHYNRAIELDPKLAPLDFIS